MDRPNSKTTWRWLPPSRSKFEVGGKGVGRVKNETTLSPLWPPGWYRFSLSLGKIWRRVSSPDHRGQVSNWFVSLIPEQDQWHPFGVVRQSPFLLLVGGVGKVDDSNEVRLGNYPKFHDDPPQVNRLFDSAPVSTAGGGWGKQLLPGVSDSEPTWDLYFISKFSCIMYSSLEYLRGPSSLYGRSTDSRVTLSQVLPDPIRTSLRVTLNPTRQVSPLLDQTLQDWGFSSLGRLENPFVSELEKDGVSVVETNPVNTTLFRGRVWNQPDFLIQ